MKKKNNIILLVWLSVFVIISLKTVSAETLIKPFMLASNNAGKLSASIRAVKSSLSNAGYLITGEYSPYSNAHVLVVTAKKLKQLAVRSSGATFGVAMRIGMTQVGGNVQVSYNNPVYTAAAYRMKDDRQWLAKHMGATLGFVKEFGAKTGLSKEALNEYHYTFGMEYYDDVITLAEYDSFQEAVKKVESSLKTREGGVFKVSRIDIPGKKIIVFHVGMTENFSSDATIMNIIDFGELKQTAHLPYEILIKGNKVMALAPRFRIAISFPDLSMMGERSFMKITRTPEDISKALTLAAGGELVDASDDEDDFDF